MDADTTAKIAIKDTTVTEGVAQVQAPTDVIVTDSKGRRLKIKGPNVLNESRLVRMMGDSAANTTYMFSYVIPAVTVVEIDGDPVGFPLSMRELEALISRLGREGLTAVVSHTVAEAQKAEAEAEAKAEEGGETSEPGGELKN